MGRLSDILNNYAKQNPVRFHMPGNKGKINFNVSTDVTELFFTDNLYNPDADTGIIHELEDKIVKCFFPNANHIHSIISCGGATLCIQAAILSLLRFKNNLSDCTQEKYLICDRASHISLINTLALLNITPLWIYSDDFIEFIEDYSKIYGNEILGVFVTSPNYYGRIKDIKAISEVCRKYSLTLVADNSHGSHLAFYSSGELHPINAGADISVDSVHKTLPALTGAAVLHTNKKFDKEMLLRSSMRAFASTSPSFLILQSIEAMIEYLTAHGYDGHKVLLENINQFRNEAEKIGFAFDYFSTEPYRIVLSAKLSESSDNINSGKFLYDYICDKNICCEFYDSDSVILIPSILNTKNDFDVLLDALRQFAGKYKFYSQPSVKVTEANISTNPVVSINLSQALKLPRKKILTDNAINKISAEAVTVYPPGVPIILPGELIDENNINYIKQIREYIDVIDM